MGIDLSGYKTVDERIRDFKAQYPTGSLRPALVERPFWFVTVPYMKQDVSDETGEPTGSPYEVKEVIVCYEAAAFRTPDDPAPGIGVASEPYPGKTRYTRNSEIMNAETSAWGRAIVAVMASEAKIASAEEVRNRAEESESVPEPTIERASPLARQKAADREAARPGAILAMVAHDPETGEVLDMISAAFPGAVEEDPERPFEDVVEVVESKASARKARAIGGNRE